MPRRHSLTGRRERKQRSEQYASRKLESKCIDDSNYIFLEMEVTKMEVDNTPVTVKVEQIDESEQKMELPPKAEEKELVENDQKLKVDVKVPVTDEKEIKKKEEMKIKIIPKEAGLAYLLVDGMVVDEGEQITMTAEEVRNYIETAVLDYIDHPQSNPLAVSNKHAMGIQAEMKEKRDEFQKLARLIDIIERDQMKFLRTDKTLRKFLTKTGGVCVDFPTLPNSVPSVSNENLLKRGISGSKVMNPPAPKPAPTPSTAPAPSPSPSTSSLQKVVPSATANVPKESPNVDKTQKPASKPENIECIDLTDETETPKPSTSSTPSFSYLTMVKHPAPLPPKPFALPNKNLPPVPPKPRLKISAEERGIVLQWDMSPSLPPHAHYSQLSSFDIFGYQEQKNIPINTLLWKKIGGVKAMTLPMACTLTQFVEGHKYHFSIRAVDIHSRCGSYSDPISIVYKQNKS